MRPPPRGVTGHRHEPHDVLFDDDYAVCKVCRQAWDLIELPRPPQDDDGPEPAPRFRWRVQNERNIEIPESPAAKFPFQKGA